MIDTIIITLLLLVYNFIMCIFFGPFFPNDVTGTMNMCRNIGLVSYGYFFCILIAILIIGVRKTYSSIRKSD